MMKFLMMDVDPNLSVSDFSERRFDLSRQEHQVIAEFLQVLLHVLSNLDRVPPATNEVRNVGRRRLEIIELGIKLFQDALKGDKRLVHEVQVGRQLQTVPEQEVGDAVDVGAEIYLFHLHDVVGFEQFDQVLLHLPLKLF